MPLFKTQLSLTTVGDSGGGCFKRNITLYELVSAYLPNFSFHSLLPVLHLLPGNIKPKVIPVHCHISPPYTTLLGLLHTLSSASSLADSLYGFWAHLRCHILQKSLPDLFKQS